MWISQLLYKFSKALMKLKANKSSDLTCTICILFEWRRFNEWSSIREKYRNVSHVDLFDLICSIFCYKYDLSSAVICDFSVYRQRFLWNQAFSQVVHADRKFYLQHGRNQGGPMVSGPPPPSRFKFVWEKFLDPTQKSKMYKNIVCMRTCREYFRQIFRHLL